MNPITEAKFTETEMDSLYSHWPVGVRGDWLVNREFFTHLVEKAAQKKLAQVVLEVVRDWCHMSGVSFYEKYWQGEELEDNELDTLLARWMQEAGMEVSNERN